jgi:uncharacterized protein YqjF (DUF2071 family)
MCGMEARPTMKRPVGTQWLFVGNAEPTVAPWADMSRPVRTGKQAIDDSIHQQSSRLRACEILHARAIAFHCATPLQVHLLERARPYAAVHLQHRLRAVHHFSHLLFIE